ncbi:hypothetical protein [Microbulbifer taiwanensis]
MMNCDCISEIEQRVTQKIKESGDFKKPVKGARMKELGFVLSGSTFTTRTVTNLEVELEGQKKKPLIPMTHNYCPFCGVSQRPEKAAEEKES